MGCSGQKSVEEPVFSMLGFHPQHAHPKNILRKDRVSPISWAFALPVSSVDAFLYTPDPFPQQPGPKELAPQLPWQQRVTVFYSSWCPEPTVHTCKLTQTPSVSPDPPESLTVQGAQAEADEISQLHTPHQPQVPYLWIQPTWDGNIQKKKWSCARNSSNFPLL